MSAKVFKAILYPLLIACIAAALYLFFYRNTWADDLEAKDDIKDYYKYNKLAYFGGQV